MYSAALPLAVVGIAWAIMGGVSIARRELNIHPGVRTKITFSGNAAVVGGVGAVVGGVVMATPVLAAVITDSRTWGDRIVLGFLIGVGVTVIGILLAFTQNR